MSVKKRKRGWQVDVTHDGQRFRKTLPTEAAALEFEKVVKDRLARGLTPEPEKADIGPRTLRRLFDLTASLHWKGSRNERTATLNARAAMDFFGEGIDPRSITTSRLDEYIVYLRTDKGNSNATVNRKVSALRKALKVGQERGWLESVPNYSQLKEADHAIRFLTEQDEQRVLGHLEAAENDALYSVVLFLIDTGARASEACRLTWEDLDLEGELVSLYQTKNSRPRSVPLTARLTNHLQVLRRRRLDQNPEALVFPGWTDRRGQTTPLSDAWIELARTLKINRRLHDLRHTFASRLVQRGAGIQAVQQLLGHTTLTTTMRYAHLAPDNLRDAVRLLEPGTASGYSPHTSASRVG